MQSVRNTLWDSTLDDRYDDITEAHKKTFGWIYQEPQSWSNFDDFLRNGEGAYWINGKPGSGKSTLLKFLYRDRRTQKALEAWCKPTKTMKSSKKKNAIATDRIEVITAAFFFWNSGARRQMTEESMLRSLLFRAMRKKEELIPIVLEEYLTQGVYRSIKSTGGFRWSLNQLRRTFIKLLEQKTLNIKLLFIIDGLDGYEGDLGKLTKWLLGLTSPTVKLVLSSRPWNVFRDAFKDMPQLRLQDLTYPDITAYVEDHLAENDQMKHLAENDPEPAQALTTEIVSKASGVFLWVKIVVGSLLDGLRNHDRISDLQSRLNLLPDDLDALYTHILSQPDAIYRIRRSQYLLMRQAYDAPPLTLAFSLSDEDDPELCLKSKIIHMTKGQALGRCEDLERRLQASCAGLLEVDYRQKTEISKWEQKMPLCNHDYYKTAFGSRIQFMHRTVKDFFDDKDRISDICSVVEGTGWDPHVALLRGWILRLKLLPIHFMGMSMDVSGNGSVEEIVKEALQFAQIAEKNTGIAQEVLLKELETTVAN